jgi:hypothetical protein
VMSRRKWVTPLTSGESLRLSRETRLVSVQELAVFFKRGGTTAARIEAIEAMPKVRREIESPYFGALLTVVLFRDRSCINLQPFPKLSQSADIENPKTPLTSESVRS